MRLPLLRKTLVTIGWTGAVVASLAVAAQPWGSPFVRKVAITVVDPAAGCAELTNIDGFSHVATSAGGRVFVALRADASRLGILICDGDSLEREEVFWLDEVGENAKDFQWCGLTSLGREGMAALCCETKTKDGSVRGYLARYVPGRRGSWLVNEVRLPEVLTTIAYLPRRGLLTGLTRPSNWLWVYDLRSGKVEVRRKIFDFVPHAYPSGRCLYRDPQGRLCGSYKGRLFRYDGETDFFEYLGMLPCEYGHLSEVALSAMAGDGKRTLVGGVCGGGYLFTVEADTGRVRPWVRPTDGTEIRALVHAGESEFWGVAAGPDQTCRLFRLRPKELLLEELGIPAGTLAAGGRKWPWHAFQISAMAVLPDGRIVLAEAARQAKLLVFDPKGLRR